MSEDFIGPRESSRTFWWYAVQVKYQSEFDVVEAVKQQHAIFDAYCPTYVKLVNKSRHKKSKPEQIEVPLFPKWLFVRFHGLWRPWGQVLECHRHVEGFMSIGESPIPIRNTEIEALRRECDLGVFNSKDVESGAVAKGDQVEIKYNGKNWSPFIGHKGEFLERVGENTKIEISIFGRPTKVEVPASMIEKIF